MYMLLGPRAGNFQTGSKTIDGDIAVLLLDVGLRTSKLVLQKTCDEKAGKRYSPPNPPYLILKNHPQATSYQPVQHQPFELTPVTRQDSCVIESNGIM
jgi:hypothetical protein